MKINKSLNIDLNIISPQKHIRIHEGDVDSVDILIGVSVDDESVDLSGVTIKYDATINNYLAEQDADGSVVDDKISIPVTQNMTAMSGLLLIDVRMIQSDQILFTQTICATVEKAVVNGSTYIDFDKVTIIQRMNALEEKMDYIEELVENFDTSKLIVSVNRPPKGAPVEVDVDLLRVGDTWILSGDNIVYKLVEARYNYSPAPGVEPRHSFIWQPLNERYGVDNTEPPTTVTYQAVIYTINEVQWSWLPVPEYFKGDHYLMQIGVDEPPTYYICKSGNMASTGVCTYTWREEGGAVDAYTKAETNELLADKMDLAPFNPTAQEIEAMPSGQLYSDTVNHKGVLKGNAGYGLDQEFFDSEYMKQNYRRIHQSRYTNPIAVNYSDVPYLYQVGDIWVRENSTLDLRIVFICDDINGQRISWRKLSTFAEVLNGLPTQGTSAWIEGEGYTRADYDVNDAVLVSTIRQGQQILELYRCSNVEYNGYTVRYTWVKVATITPDMSVSYYTKNEVLALLDERESLWNKVTELSSSSTDTQYPSAKCVYDFVTDQIGDIETALSEV